MKLTGHHVLSASFRLATSVAHRRSRQNAVMAERDLERTVQNPNSGESGCGRSGFISRSHNR